jgi:hypothetical protein
MRRYRKLNEREFHRMISEATMRVVARVLQEAGNSDEYEKELPNVDIKTSEPYNTDWDYGWLDRYEKARAAKGDAPMTQADFDALDQEFANMSQGQRNAAARDWGFQNMPQSELSHLKNRYETEQSWGWNPDWDYYNDMSNQYGGIADRYNPNDYNARDYAQH